MVRKTSIIAAVVLGAASFAAAADGISAQVVYGGGHDTTRLTQVAPQAQMTAPYALTGSERVQSTARAENALTGSQYVSPRTGR